MQRYVCERLGGADDQLPVLLTDPLELSDALQGHQMRRREEPVLHVGNQVRPTGYRDRALSVLRQQRHGVLHRVGPVISEGRESKHA